MSKTEELRAIVQLMVANYLAAEDYASLCDNYRILVHEQKIMKGLNWTRGKRSSWTRK